MSKQRKRLSANEKVSKHPSVKLLMVLILAVCSVVLIVHWPVLSAQALSLDDDQYLTENSLVQNPGWDSMRRFLTEVLKPSKGGYYQPMTMISLMVDYTLGGRSDNLRQFHRSSLALHVINTALVIVLLYLLFSHVPIAAGVGLLFGLHPINIEPIAWLSERTTMLGSFFALLCLIFYVRYAAKRNWKLYVACLVMYALALMSKPTTIPLPLLMLLLDYWPLRRWQRNQDNSVYRLTGRAIGQKLPFFALGGLSFFITFVSRAQVLEAHLVMPTEYGLLNAPLIICHNIIFYLYKIVWPVNLSSHYPFPEALDLSDPMILAGVIGTFILIVLLAVSLRWTKAILIGWLIYFVALAPTIQIIGFSKSITADKYVYLPSIGLLMLLAFLLVRLGKSPRGRLSITVIVLLAASGESLSTRRHLAFWRDTVSLYEYMLTIFPNSAVVHNNLGSEFEQLGELDKAAEHFQLALQDKPYYAEAHENLGGILVTQGKLDKAVGHFRHALQARPDYVEAYYNLGIVFAAQGKLDQAIDCYRKTLQSKPNFFKAHNNLGTVLAQQGLLDEAIKHFRCSLQIEPDDAETHYNLANALKQQGKPDEAAEHYRQAILIKPDHSEAHCNLGNVFLQDKPAQAIRHYRRAILSKPDFALAHHNLALALRKTGQLDQALGEFRQAASLKPDYAAPLVCMAQILAANPDTKKRDLSQAILLAEQACQLTEYQDMSILNTMATIYAKGGRFEQAITTTQKMIELASAAQADELVNYLHKQLEQYREKKP